jgi:hypothetical protein
MTRTHTLLAWLVLLVVGFSNGTLRQLGYARFFSDRTAHRISVATGIVAIGFVVLLLTRRWELTSPRQAWCTGAVWLALTFLFETGMGLASGHPWSQIFGAYALWEGELWPLVLAFILISPRLALAVHVGRARARHRCISA